ncbi:EAL domain-containing protein [Deinococcus sonorensis]|uniref:EAL domain-containing protein n=2 Tax=Deinococcus sonorensis TaxID=309891 RepID=A0AAU7UBT3_9DEIO
MKADDVFQSTLRDLMRLYAPQATLLAQVGHDLLWVSADGRSDLQDDRALVPPDEWLERGELTWLTRDGTLLGLLWSEHQPVSPEAVESLTLLLVAARQDRGSTESGLLISQLPAPVAWLDDTLKFQQVSQHFLTLHGLSEPQVVGRTVQQVFPERTQLPQLLQRTLSGQPVRLPVERVAGPAGTLWLRGEARPYFARSRAGLLWTTQDASAERQLGLQLDSLLDDVDALLALLDHQGRVQNASAALLALNPPHAAELLGAPFWTWPCWEQSPQPQLKEMVDLARQGGAARTDIRLVGGRLLRVSLRGDLPGRALLSAECSDLSALHELEEQAALHSSLLREILSRSSEATLLLNQNGRVTLANEEAAQLLGIDASRLLGAPFARLLGDMGVQVYDASGQHRLTHDLWPRELEPAEQELTLVSATGVRRTVRRLLSPLPNLEGQRPGAMLNLRDITALRRVEARLRHDTHHDPLTGLLNRTGLRAQLMEQQGQPRTVLTLSLDGCSALSAALGRTASDALLIQLAARLLTGRRGSQVARLSDHRFALLAAPRSDSPEQLQVTAELELYELERLLAAPFRVAGQPRTLSFTVGAAHGTVSADDVEGLLVQAETALVYAAHQGAGLSAVYHQAMQTQVARDFRLEQELPGAVMAGQFALSYQPVISLQTGEVQSAEALMRWHHPELGTLTPAMFLPLAARTQVIGQLGEWAIQAAMQDRAAWQRAHPGVRVSVNLSLDELLRQDDLEQLLPLLHAQGAPDFEMSAGSLLHYSERTLNLLERLREAGAGLWVDDFGDGASSLTALERFPLSGIKLHPSFVARLPHERAVRLLEGTTALASSLGLSVTAVGVETAEQLEVLRQAGVGAAQGYLYAAPMTAGELSGWQLQPHGVVV